MNVDNNISLKLYECMLKIRYTEEAIAERYSESKMRCPTHLSTGQEGIAAGVCSALNEDDFVVSTHRSHAHYIGKGGHLNKMIAEIYGKTTGCSAGKGGSMHLVDKNVNFMGSTSIVGNSIPVGVGLGLSIRLQDTNKVSCIFFGDAAVEEGVFFESVNFAVLYKLPVLFICENNLYSVYSPLNVRQPEGRKIFEMTKGFGIHSEYGNGNNVFEVYEKVKKAIKEIRLRNGPYFFEFSTYRWREHCGANFDNDLGYRTEDEFLEWKKKDPVSNLESQLLKEDVLDEKQMKEIKESIKIDVDKAFIFAEQSPFPDSNEAFTQLYRD